MKTVLADEICRAIRASVMASPYNTKMATRTAKPMRPSLPAPDTRVCHQRSPDQSMDVGKTRSDMPGQASLRIHVSEAIDPGPPPRRVADDHGVRRPHQARRAPSPRREPGPQVDAKPEANRARHEEAWRRRSEDEIRIVVRHDDVVGIHRQDFDVRPTAHGDLRVRSQIAVLLGS